MTGTTGTTEEHGTGPARKVRSPPSRKKLKNWKNGTTGKREEPEELEEMYVCMFLGSLKLKEVAIQISIVSKN